MDGLAGGRLDATSGHITVKHEADGHVLYMSGDVDAPVVTKLESEHTLDGLLVVAVDVGALSYIDSTGLTLLVRWALDAKRDGRPAEIRRTTRNFNRILELAGLTSMFVRT